MKRRVKRRPVPPNSARCKATVSRHAFQDGRCENIARENGYCVAHDPNNRIAILRDQIARHKRELGELEDEMDRMKKLAQELTD
jgi:uncharacterized small protein (DUF1192 family)